MLQLHELRALMTRIALLLATATATTAGPPPQSQAFRFAKVHPWPTPRLALPRACQRLPRGYLPGNVPPAPALCHRMLLLLLLWGRPVFDPAKTPPPTHTHTHCAPTLPPTTTTDAVPAACCSAHRHQVIGNGMILQAAPKQAMVSNGRPAASARAALPHPAFGDPAPATHARTHVDGAANHDGRGAGVTAGRSAPRSGAFAPTRQQR